jgi:hypothetical protein
MDQLKVGAEGYWFVRLKNGIIKEQSNFKTQIQYLYALEFGI